MSKEDDFAAFVGRLARTLAAKVGITALDKTRWKDDVIERGLERDLKAGALAVLVDGLDHVAPATIAPFLLETEDARWRACPVVVAGRPHAVRGWADAKRPNTVDGSRWRFVQPDEFDGKEAKAYLDKPGEESRYDRVEASLRGLARVPRVLEYVRELTREQIEFCRTSADIYLLAIDNLLERTIVGGGERLRGMNAGYARNLLAAMAFRVLCPTVDETNRVDPAPIVDTDVDVMADLRERMHALGYANVDLEDDLNRLGAFATIVGNRIVSAAATEAGPPASFVWSNLTVRDFLAAYWLARCSSEDDAARMPFHVFRPRKRTPTSSTTSTCSWRRCRPMAARPRDGSAPPGRGTRSIPSARGLPRCSIARGRR